MTVTFDRNEGRCVLEIEGEMTIFNAAELKTNLLEHFSSLEECGELSLDLSKVSEMDSSGFQLLLMLKRDTGRLNKALKITGQSRAVRSALEIYRMVDYFEQ